MTKVYKHVFFDLDKTIWDFERNSKEALGIVAAKFNILSNYGIQLDDFIAVYEKVNERMWKEHREGKQNKDSIRRDRFRLALSHFNIEANNIAAAMNDLYIETASASTHLIEGALDLLDYLRDKYVLHVITNGFKETQHRKLSNCQLNSYFTSVTTCDDAKATKPDSKIFNYALKQAGAKRNSSIMIGDHLEVDLLGARRAGMDQIYFNQHNYPFEEKVTYYVNTLKEIKDIL